MYSDSNTFLLCFVSEYEAYPENKFPMPPNMTRGKSCIAKASAHA